MRTHITSWFPKGTISTSKIGRGSRPTILSLFKWRSFTQPFQTCSGFAFIILGIKTGNRDKNRETLLDETPWTPSAAMASSFDLNIVFSVLLAFFFYISCSRPKFVKKEAWKKWTRRQFFCAARVPESVSPHHVLETTWIFNGYFYQYICTQIPLRSHFCCLKAPRIGWELWMLNNLDFEPSKIW